MNLFRKKQNREPAPPRTEQSPLASALAEVQAADHRLSDLHREFLGLQERYRLLVDENSNIFQPLVADGTSRDEIARKIQEHRIARGIALRQFHAVLGEWAKVKSDAVESPPAI